MNLAVPDSSGADAERARRAISVSVLLPNYNHADHIGRALSALAEQSRPADEIIVIDDASTDHSIEVIESFRTRLPQIRLIRNPSNVGVAASNNRALSEARSDYVVCTAADDWMRPRFIERMLTVVQRFPGLPLYISQCVRYFTDTGELREFGPESE